MGIALKLYYYDDNDNKVYVKTCDAYDSYKSVLDASLAWCRENCEERGVMDFYYNGHKMWLEF